ncbi:DUF4352 domain-containing protein [Leifsonia xyli]|uniref:DUF4352 domain-containing protein n=1 Tax=Leifsonia xyli TaxID=1575 RepID=UPI003D67915A
MLRSIACTTTILAATVAVAGLTLTGCSGGGAAGSGSGGATEPGHSAAAAPTPAGVGLNTPLTVGTFTYTATAMKDAGPTVGSAPLTQTAQGTYIEVDFTIANAGNSAATFLSNYVKLKDATGKTYDADPTASLYASPNQQAWVAAINPGNTLTGPILFDVPAGTQPTSVLVSDNAFSGGKEIRLQ